MNKVEQAERAENTARVAYAAAIERRDAAANTKMTATLALSSTNPEQARITWRKANEDHELACAEVVALEARVADAGAAVIEARRQEANADAVARREHVQRGVTEIVAHEARIRQLLLEVDSLRNEQISAFTSEIAPYQEKYERRQPRPYEARPRGVYECIADVLVDHGGLVERDPLAFVAAAAGKPDIGVAPIGGSLLF